MSEKLKSCPFCGELPIINHESDDFIDCGFFTYWVVCPKCGIRTKKSRDKTLGVEAWNRRVGEHDT